MLDRLKVIAGQGLFIALVVFLQTSTAAELPELSPAAKRDLQKLERPIVLRGDYFKAVQAAYSDFSRELASKEAFGKTQDPQRAEVILWLSKIENYDIYVSQTPKTYEVHFGVTLRNQAPMVFGGGAVYVIDRHTFLVKKKTLLK